MVRRILLPDLRCHFVVSYFFLLCAACHEGRAEPSVSGMNEKVELGQRPRTCGHSMARYPFIARNDNSAQRFFFWPVPCALEALTVTRCGLVHSKTGKQSKKGNTIKCSKQGFAQIAQASLLTTQGCTFLKQKQRIRLSFGNKAVK